MLVVGIGEYAISKEESENIITYALGSCVAFIVHCPIKKYTALAHVVLPNSVNRENNVYLNEKEGYFADIIVPRLINFFIKELHCNPLQLQVTLVGGADALNDNDVFKVGKKNVKKIHSILENYKIGLYNLDVGGNVSRTVRVEVVSGLIEIKKQNMIL